jgi:hypothetical protein
MTLEHQVCSLDLAKRLKELGVKQESLFYWWRHEGDSRYILINPILDNRTPKSYVDAYAQAEMYSAFTVAELGEMLPRSKFIYSYPGFVESAWCCEMGTGQDGHREYANTEANARAKMLIYLLGHNLLTNEK